MLVLDSSLSAFLVGTNSGQTPTAGTTVKLTMKMKDFHSLEVIYSGISLINYKPKS